MKLSPEQERAAIWAINATGPTQVKGSPGTGKSTVALYRVKSLIQRLQETGQPTQRILYTTYTNALVKSSDQQLKELLGEDSACVKVMTIHSSKGLEFPIVALAGFINSRYTHMPQDVREEGQEEVLERDRRTIFVGMTRAMRTLLVIVPANTRSLLLTGFDPMYWNLEQ